MPTLHWIGKNKVINHHTDVPFRVLEHSYHFENAEECASPSPLERAGGEAGNKIIHGDNLDALKALLPEYEGRIKCIYIDPPYNTGNEGWVYNDNVNDPKIRKWLGQVVGKEAEDLTRHDKWLCMMYPRLKLLHKLLADDGTIFISIDDNEQANLKLICDEIFGGNNYLGLITRKQSSGSKNDKGNDKIVTTADYILPYKKKDFNFFPYQIENKKSFSYKDKQGYFSLRALEMQGGGDTLPQRSKMGYSIYYNKLNNNVKLLFDYNLENNPVYEKPNAELLELGYECFRPRKRDMELGRWRWGDETFMDRFNNDMVYFDKGRVFMKERASDSIDKYPEAIIVDYLNTQGTNELKAIFERRIFDFPKPSELLEFLFKVATTKNSIILDSFAGSGTTAHAVLNLNKQDGGNRKFILVEMEDYAESITAERVKRVISGYGDKEGTGGSFDYYELGEPLFLDDGNLNETVGIEKIRSYIWYTETNKPMSESEFTELENKQNSGNSVHSENSDSDSYLGVCNDTAYFFHFLKDEITTLNHEFLSGIKTKAEQYVIYADNCVLTKDFMTKHHIIFKKIPRDVTRF